MKLSKYINKNLRLKTPLEPIENSKKYFLIPHLKQFMTFKKYFKN